MGTGRVLPDWLSGQRFDVTVRKFELTKSLFNFFSRFCFNLLFLGRIGMGMSFFSVFVEPLSPYPLFLHNFPPSSLSFPLI